MQINLPGIQLTQPVNQQVRDVLNQLRPNQVFYARILKVGDNGSITLRVGQSQFTANTPVPAQQGEIMALKVVELSPSPIFKILQQGNIDTLISAAFKSALPQQQPIDIILNQLLNQNADQVKQLPAQVVQSVEKLIKSIMDAGSPDFKQQINQLISRSGILTEALLMRGSVSENDLRLNLSRLLNQIPVPDGAAKAVPNQEIAAPRPDTLAVLIRALQQQPSPPVVREALMTLSTALAKLPENLAQTILPTLINSRLIEHPELVTQVRTDVPTKVVLFRLIHTVVASLPQNVASTTNSAGAQTSLPANFAMADLGAYERLNITDFVKDTVRLISLLPQSEETRQLLASLQLLPALPAATVTPADKLTMILIRLLTGLQPKSELVLPGQMTNASKSEPSLQQLLFQDQQQLNQLIKMIQGALARIHLNQLTTYQRDEGTQFYWHFEVPVRFGDRVDMFHFKMGKRPSPQDQVNDEWELNLDFELGNLGPVEVQLNLASENQLSLLFKVTKKSTEKLIQSKLHLLETGLSNAGLQLKKITTVQTSEKKFQENWSIESHILSERV